MKKTKIILPFIAILFAIVGAFATNAAPKYFAKLRVSIRGGVCVQDGWRTEGGQVTCTYQNDGSTLLDLYLTDPPLCIAYNGNGIWSAD